MQRLEASSAVGLWSGGHDNSSSGSCSSSLAPTQTGWCKRWRKRRWTALTKGKERDWWSIDLEGEVEKLEVSGRGSGPKATPWNSKWRWATDAPQGESVKTKSSKRKVIRVESDETKTAFVGRWQSAWKKQRNYPMCRVPSANHSRRWWWLKQVISVSSAANEQLAQQGEPRLNSWQWRAVVKKKAHRGIMWKNCGKLTIYKRNVGVYFSQKGRGKEDSGRCGAGQARRNTRSVATGIPFREVLEHVRGNVDVGCSAQIMRTIYIARRDDIWEEFRKDAEQKRNHQNGLSRKYANLMRKW